MSRHGGSYLSQTDTIMWTVEADPLLRSTIGGIALLDRPPSIDTLRARMEHVVAMVPTMRARVVTTPLHPTLLRWAAVDDLDVNSHVHHIKLPPPASMAQLLEFVRRSMLTGLDKARPLWEFTLVEGLCGDRAALVMKAHHVLTDGIGAVQLAAHLFDLERHPAGPLDLPAVEVTPSTDTSAAALLRDALGHDLELLGAEALRLLRRAAPELGQVVAHPLGAVRDALETVRSVGRTVAPVFDRKSPVMRERRPSFRIRVLDVASGPLRRTARRYGGTLNDVFLAAVTGAMKEYHRAHGAEVDELRMAMPISLRSADDSAGGNHLTVMRFVVPIEDEPLGDRITRLHDVVAAVRAERSLAHTEAIAAGLNLMPRGVLGAMLERVDFLCSNVPGFTVPLYLAGAEVLRYHPLGPTAGSAVNITLMSYRDRCCIGLTIDDAAIPDADRFVDCLRSALREVAGR